MQKKSASDDVRDDVEGNDGSLEMGAREAALPPKHQRPERSTLERGPSGHIGQPGLDRNDRALIHTRAGTFRLDSSLSGKIPAQLRRNLDLIAGQGGAHAYLVALPSEDAYRQGSIRKQLLAQGLELVDFLPKEAVLLRVRPQDIRKVLDNNMFDHVEPYHPAFKIETLLGRVAFWDQQRAESETFNLRVMSHRGEDLEQLTARIERLGGIVVHQVDIGGRGFLEVDLHFSKVFDLAGLGAVASILERREYRVLNTVGPSIMQTGRWNRGATPFFDAGIDGGGETRCIGTGTDDILDSSPGGDDRVSGNGKWIVDGGNLTCESAVLGNDASAGLSLVAPRVICAADNGASLDAAGLAHSTTEPCIGGDCTSGGSSMGATVGSGHRKVQSYTTGSATDVTSSGDLTNCDSAASGAGSHGNQVANILVGNPSNGINGLGITRDDNDQDTNNEFDERFLPLDGEARGARLIFQDISITTTGSGNPCNQLPSATGPGANFVDQGNVVPGSIAQRLTDCAGASVIVFPFGVPNFDSDRQLDIDTGHYAAGAVDIDAHMFENRAQAIFLPTGNDGADPFDGNDIYPDDPGHPSCPGDPGCPFTVSPTRIQVNSLATAKNATTVGSSRADTIDFFGNFDETENYTNFTSKGPATFASRRRAPMVMGQGSDLGTSPSAKLLFDNLFNSDVVLKSSDNDNAGVVEGVIDEGINGTSFSASHVAGGAALIHDYFAQGAYPSGSLNTDDRQATVSGALTRALVVASGNFMTAFVQNLTRWNDEQGTGRMELSNVLPLSNFHGGPVAGDPRRALRPPDGGTPATIPTVPTSLLVFDEYFEGGNTWSKNGGAIGTGLAVLEEGVTTLESTFTVVESNEQLRIGLSWYDPASALDAGGLLINNLDLEVEDPNGNTYLGNNFTSEFSIHTSQGGVAVDSRNPVETVLLNRPVLTGTWKVRVKTSDPSVLGANNAVCTVGAATTCGVGDLSAVINGPITVCTSGGDGVCNTTATGGDVQLVANGNAPLPFGLSVSGGHLGSGRSAARLSENTYDCSGALDFTILETSGQSAAAVNAAVTLTVTDDAGVIVDTETGFALLKTGVNYSTFNSIPVQSSGSQVSNNGILDVTDGDSIRLTYVDGSPSATITASAAVDCTAFIDLAIFGTTGLNHQFIITGGCDIPFGGTFTQGDLNFDEGENILYQVAFMNSSPNTIPGLTGTLTCNDLTPGPPNPCDTLSPLPQTVAIGDVGNIPPNTTLGVVATAVSFNLQVAADLTTQIPNASDRVVELVTTLGSSATDVLVDQITFSHTHALHADDERLHYSTDRPRGTKACDLASSTPGDFCQIDGDCTGGSCIGYSVAVDRNRDGKIDTDLVTRELISYEPITYDVSTGLANRNVTTGNALTDADVVGNPGILDADGPDDRFGKRCFLGSTSSATTCQDDGDCVGAETCRSDDPIPWGMDGITTSAGGLTHASAGADGQWVSFENPLSDPGFPTPTEIWSSGGGGACGFQSQDRGGALFRRAGIWHAGNAAASPGLTDCPDYPTPSNGATPEGVEYLKWALISPIIQKVNTTTDARGFEFTVSMERTAWNENVLMFDTSVYVITNLDNDLRTATNVSADDDPQQKDDFNALFVSEAYVNTAVQGPLTNLAQGQNRFGGSREVSGPSVFSRMDPDDSLDPGGVPVLTGDEVGVARTIGGPRTQQVVSVCQDPILPCADYSDPTVLAALPHPLLDSIPGGDFNINDDWLDIVSGTVLCGPNGRADTAAAGGDLQSIAQGASCSNASSVVVTGLSGVLSKQTLASAQQSLVSGPVRNNEQDQTGYEDTFGASTDKFQFAFQWMIIEGAVGSMGFTADDIVWEWDETHPTDQTSAENSCADICIGGDNDGEPCSTGCAGGECALGAGLAGRKNEPGVCIDRCVGGLSAGNSCVPGDPGDQCIVDGGSCPNAGTCVTGEPVDCSGAPSDCISAANQCAVISVDRLTLLDCNTPLLVTVQDLSEGTSTLVDTVTVNVRSNSEPFGEEFTLTETTASSHIFQGFVPISSTFNSPGVIFTVPSGESSVVASYKDPDCDLDGFDEELLQVGQLGENDFNDVDGDGSDNIGTDGIVNSRVTGLFDDDNCFDAASGTDVYNPSQLDSDTFCIDVDGASNGTFCAAGEGAAGDAFCAGVDSDFPTCRGDRVGDACDNCPDDFNPAQEDVDVDGIGDVCELDFNAALGCQDLDFDLVCNSADNCPSVPNPGQQDADSNGVGDACDGAGDADGDTIPDGADNCRNLRNFQQQDADGDGIGDACESFVEDFDADGVLDILDNCPGTFNPQDALGIQSDIDQDGQGDSCDPDSDDDNNGGVPDDLLQFFVAAQCNLNLGTVSILAVDVLDGGDADGFADEGETIVLDITVKNNATDSTGAPLNLTNMAIGISSSSPSVACVLDATSIYGDLAAGGELKNSPSDQFSFVVQTSQKGLCNAASTNAGVACNSVDVGFCVQDAGALPDIAACDASGAAQTLALTDIRTATFAVTVSSDQITGQASATSFTLTLDLDIIGDTTGGGDLDVVAPATLPGQMCENFEAILDPDGDPAAGANATSRLTQTFLGHRPGGVVLATDIIPVISGTNCSNSPIGPSDCSINTTVNDWHLHSFDEEPSNAPGGNQAHGGSKSLHMARHLNPNNPLNTTYRFRQLTAFYSPPINIALSGNRALEYWQIARMADDNAINFITGQAGDYGILQLRLDQDSNPAVDDFGPWLRIEAVINPYDHLKDNNFTSSCKFDPLDDFFDASAGGVTNETMCFPQPGYSDQGEFTGTGVSGGGGAPCTDADGNGHNDCGSAGTLGPGFSETGSVGTGSWIKARFDLGGFLGRRAQVRWIFSSIAFGNSPTVLSYNETPGSPGQFDISERDDGWLIDDICFTGLLNNQLNLIIDGGDDVFDPGTQLVTCGANKIAETFAEGDDVQTQSISPAGGANICANASDVVVSPGANAGNDSVATDTCPTNPASFCGTATALVAGQASPVTLTSLAAGQSVTLNAGASSLDACVGGSIQYQFVRCDSLSGACVADSILKDFSSASTQLVSPQTPTRYAVSVRCSTLSSCADTSLVTVLPVNPAACHSISIGVDCGSTPCTVGSTIDISWNAVGGFSYDVDRGVATDLALAVTTLGSNVGNGVAGPTVSDLPWPQATPLDFYLVSCDLPGPKPSGNQRIGGAPAARFQNP